MVGFAELRDADPARYDRDADDWEVQAAALEEYVELAQRFTAALSGWEGLTAVLANRRAAELAAVFGDTPRRFRTAAAALRRAGREFKAAQDLAAEAEGEAREYGYHITDDGDVFTAVSPFLQAVGVQAQPIPGEHPERRQARIQTMANRALKRATKADEELARALPLIQEGLAWEGDNPGALSAEEAARLLRRAASGDPEALAQLRRHQDQFGDPYFAKELAQNLGPDGFTQLPGAIQHNLGGADTKNGRTVLGMLSDTLAAASDPRNPAWDIGGDSCQEFLNRLKDEGRSVQTESAGLPYDGYWGLGQVMAAGDGKPPYSEEFLGDVGNDMVGWDQENMATLDWPYTSGPHSLTDRPDRLGFPGEDPLAGLMNAADGNPEGAQALFEGDAAGSIDDSGDKANNLDYLMTGRDWSDSGDALGEAIEAAADPRSDNLRAADRIATQTVENIGTAMQDDPDHATRALGGLQDGVGRMLADRIGDVNTSLIGSDIADVPGRFTHQDLVHTLEFATKDQDGYDALVKAELGHLRQEIDAAAADKDIGQVEVAARNGSTALGAIVEARVHGLDAEARKQDELHGVLSNYSQKGLGLVSLTTGPLAGITNLAAGEITGKVFELTAPNAQADVREQKATYDDQAKTAIKDMVARSVADHQLYSEKNSPQTWLEDTDNDVRPTFLDQDGEIMTWDRLVTKPGAYASFDEWVQNVGSWSKGRSAGEDGYQAGQQWYTTERSKAT